MPKKPCVVILLALLLGGASGPAAAQEQPPFTFTLQGGLFLPAKQGFSDRYQSSSDLIWAAGMALPVGSGMFLTAELGYFGSSGIPDPSIDSTAKYSQRIIHAGILHKRMLSQTLALRLSAGINRVSVQEKVGSQRTPERSLETGNRFGYYGGAGVEQLLDDPHLSLFADVVYDYSRSREKDFPGDFGGLRVVFGLNLILF